MLNGLEKILNLAKKTGDNVIVFNPAKPNDSYVILALNSYERLVDNCLNDSFLTEDDLADKINRDIAPWEMEEGGFFEDDEEDEDDDWPYPEDESFLPEDIFGPDKETLAESGDEEEKQWEEEVNYLYPVEEDKFVGASDDEDEAPFEEMAEDKPSVEDRPSYAKAPEDNAEILKKEEKSFNSVADILENKGVWTAPEEQN